MQTVETTHATNHSADIIWEALAAFNKVHRWHPLVKTSPGTPREQFGVGAARTCHFHDGTHVKEKVIAFVPGKSIDIELSEFNFPFKEANARVEILPGAKGSIVKMTMNFAPKFGPLGALMAILMIKPMMGKMLAEMLLSLDEHLSTSAVAA